MSEKLIFLVERCLLIVKESVEIVDFGLQSFAARSILG